MVKAEKDLTEPTVLLKAKAAHSWCINASTIDPPNNSQSKTWEYLVLSDALYKANSGLGFESFIPICRQQRDRMIERFDSSRTF